MAQSRFKRFAIGIGIGFIIIPGAFGILSAIREGNSPFGLASKSNTIEAYEEFIRTYPNDPRISDAKKRVGQLKFAFQPKFYLIFEDKDVSGEISFFNTSITNNIDKASTLAYVTTSDVSSSEDWRVTVRLVDIKTKRERTIVGTSTGPEWVRVTVGSERIASSGGGSHTIDGHRRKGAHNGHGLLLQDILAYAQTLSSDADPYP